MSDNVKNLCGNPEDYRKFLGMILIFSKIQIKNSKCQLGSGSWVLDSRAPPPELNPAAGTLKLPQSFGPGSMIGEQKSIEMSLLNQTN